MSQPPDPIDDFFNNLKKILSSTWNDTGFGHLEIDSEPVNNKQDKIRVLLRGSTHYCYVFSKDDWEKSSWNKE